MLLHNLTPIHADHAVDISVMGEKILTIRTTGKKDLSDPFQIHFTSATVFPGLINSHDHLDFNCFPILGQRKYSNYSEWGLHIHKIFKKQIDAVLRIPQNIRTEWGMYKNLLAGVTTVVNHGSRLKIENPIINVFQEPQNLHSVKFEKAWKWKLNNPILKNKDCVIHTGEGSDKQSSAEIDQLLKFNLLKRNLVGVHGVAMNTSQAKKFKGLVWCPESNRVMLNKHARIADLKTHTPVLFGTDSTLTGNWNIWHHLRLARSLQQTNDSELFAMLTSSPAKLWNMNNGEILSDKDADMVITKKKTGIPTWDDIFKTNPEDILLIIHKGEIKLFDKAMHSQLISLPLNMHQFSRVSIKGHIKFVSGNLPELISLIKSYNPQVNLPIEASRNVNSIA
jgi:cytosine/adenosine deaminase-related metal-dependent hydrolase